MPLCRGIHHLAFITSDIDRLIAFYERLCDAQVVLDEDDEGVRHALVEVAPNTLLHPFQVPGVDVPEPKPMFERGRLDHFGLNADSEEAFRELRRRIIDAGAGDGVVTDLGPVLSVSFTDPDGAEHEVIWEKPGVPMTASLKRAEWKTVAMDQPSTGPSSAGPPDPRPGSG